MQGEFAIEFTVDLILTKPNQALAPNSKFNLGTLVRRDESIVTLRSDASGNVRKRIQGMECGTVLTPVAVLEDTHLQFLAVKFICNFLQRHDAVMIALRYVLEWGDSRVEL